MGLDGVVRGAALLLCHPRAACGPPLRYRHFLSRKPCRVVVRPRGLARRSLRRSTPSAPERLAADLRLLHDLRSAHRAGLAARAFHFRAFGRDVRALSRVLHADAACPLCGADRTLPAHSPHRPPSSSGAVRLEPPGHSRSIAVTLTSRLKTSIAFAALIVAMAGPAAAFCGFYVAKADSKLFNKSSKVVLSRDGNQTAITMASDYEGDPKEFALAIPVPTFIRRRLIGRVATRTIDHLDAYTAPRLVEYHDEDPCLPRFFERRMS